MKKQFANDVLYTINYIKDLMFVRNFLEIEASYFKEQIEILKEKIQEKEKEEENKPRW